MEDELLAMIDDATRRLTVTVSAMSGDDVAKPSLLPGWTRGHVLTHLARNADALRNLLTWARTGSETPAYASMEAREADVAAGAGRGLAEQAADLSASSSAFRAEAAAFPHGSAAWQAQVSVLGSVPFPAAQVLVRRLAEVELHHTDLGSGYTRADWPASFAAMDLPEPMQTFRATR